MKCWSQVWCCTSAIPAHGGKVRQDISNSIPSSRLGLIIQQDPVPQKVEINLMDAKLTFSMGKEVGKINYTSIWQNLFACLRKKIILYHYQLSTTCKELLKHLKGKERLYSDNLEGQCNEWTEFLCSFSLCT